MCTKLTMIIIVLEMPKIFSNRVEQSLPFTQSRTYLFAEGNDSGYAAGVGVEMTDFESVIPSVRCSVAQAGENPEVQGRG